MGPPTFGNPIVFVSKSIHPLQHWCYLFRGVSEQLKSWKRGRRLKYFASEMKIFCSGDEKSLIGCNQPRWSGQYSEGQIFIIGYRKRILKVQKDWKVTITVFLNRVQKPKIQETRKGCQYLCNSCGEVCCSTGSTLQQGRSGKCPIKKSGPLVQWTSSTAGPDVAVIIQNPWLAVSVCATRPAWWRPDEDKWFHVWGVFL